MGSIASRICCGESHASVGPHEETDVVKKPEWPCRMDYKLAKEMHLANLMNQEFNIPKIVKVGDIVYYN
jgi:hypothetical protein